MSISSVNQNTNSAYTPSAADTSSNTGSAQFSALLNQAQENSSDTASANTQAPISYVTTADASLSSRPDMKTFMDATGADANTASELIYGVIGSNTDTRNWQLIMSSSDPITAARQATGEMYNLPSQNTPDTSDTHTSIVGHNGNFSLIQHTDDTNAIDYQGLMLTDKQGNCLRDAGCTTDQILRNAWLFGFDTHPLSSLGNAAKSFEGSPLAQAITAISQADAPAQTPISATQPSATTANTSTQPQSTAATPDSTSAQSQETAAASSASDADKNNAPIAQKVAAQSQRVAKMSDSNTHSEDTGLIRTTERYLADLIRSSTAKTNQLLDDVVKHEG